MPAGPHSEFREQNKRQRNGLQRKGQICPEGRPHVDDVKLSALLAGKQLGFRHPLRERVRRLIERQLISESPSKNAATQQHETEREPAQALASTEPKRHGLYS